MKPRIARKACRETISEWRAMLPLVGLKSKTPVSAKDHLEVLVALKQSLPGAARGNFAKMRQQPNLLGNSPVSSGRRQIRSADLAEVK